MADKSTILVIGDVMLDKYVSGSVDRISPEAPVPVVKVQKEWSVLGGAGNVAANVSSLGGKAVLIGLVGNDGNGQEVHSLCTESGIEAHFLQTDSSTVTKTRIVSGQQIVRVDHEDELVWSEDNLASFRRELIAVVTSVSVILVSDYAKGTVSDELLSEVFSVANKNGIRVLIDPKRADWSAYSGAFLISPNLKELSLAFGKTVANEDNAVVDASRKLKSSHKVENLLCTRSSYGMTLLQGKGLLNIPTRAQEVFDVSGAGDTVLAALGVYLSEGKTLSDSAFGANAAAGLAVSKSGTATVKRSDLNDFLKRGEKLIERSAIDDFKSSAENRKIIFTNGCFDVLHQGHRQLLKEAKALGDILVVGLNSDESVKRLKGSERPINSESVRVHALAALSSVDAIIVFQEDTPFELISELKPEVLVKGGDYSAESVVGANLVNEVVIIPLVEGISTTGLQQD